MKLNFPSKIEGSQRGFNAAGTGNFLKRPFLTVTVVLGVVVFAGSDACGQITRDWTAGSSLWRSASGWSPSGVPGLLDTANFNLNIVDTVFWDTVTGDQEIGRLNVLAGVYTFDGTSSTQHTLTLNSTSSAFRVRGPTTVLNVNDLHLFSNNAGGYGWLDDGATLNLNGAGTAGASFTTAGSMYNYGTFNLTNGAVASHGFNYLGGTASEPGVLNILGGSSVTNTDGVLGYGSFSTGTATVSGPGSAWHNTNALTLGSGTNATGNLNIDAAGRVTVGNGNPFYGGTHLTIGSTGSTAALNINQGTLTNSGYSVIGSDPGTDGFAQVSGSSSVWNNTSSMIVGYRGTGQLDVLDGGIVSSSSGMIGDRLGSFGTVNISNPGSQWNHPGGLLSIGASGNAILNVSDSGVVSTNEAYIGRFGSGVGTATINGPGSQLNVTTALNVGYNGTGTLNIENGGDVTSSSGHVGFSNGSDGTVNITGFGSSWVNSDSLTVGGTGATGVININSGGILHVGNGPLSGGGTNINISDSSGAQFSVLNGTVNNSGLADIARWSGTAGTATVSGSSAVWNNSSTLYVGDSGTATLNVLDGGTLTNGTAYLGRGPGGFGTAYVGSNGQWTSNSGLIVGSQGDGTLTIDTGGDVYSNSGVIGSAFSSSGDVTITGDGSTWTSGNLSVGQSGTGNLNVQSGARVDSGFGIMANSASATGTVMVNGMGSTWAMSSDLNVGVHGSATLEIENNGLVTVEGTTYIGDTGTINLDGGRLEFGTMSLDDFGAINALNGSLAGTLNHSSYTAASTLASLQTGPVISTDVMLTNSGTLYGNASLSSSLVNSADGSVETVSGERLRFAGSGNNSGEFNNFGGQMRFNQDVTNNAGGFIGGRGQFIAEGGWNNQGVMAFTAGNSDILGDVINLAGGQILTSGFGVTTFFDDVVHNGTEIRTADGSATVFLGGVTGAGAFTGSGDVFFEGDLRPGNSPDVIGFEGDVFFGTGANSHFEIAGTRIGMFDRMEIAGDLLLDGLLDISLIDGFELGLLQEFVIADVGDSLLGQFRGLDEGDLVGTWGGTDLFITYGAGDGNDVALFTAAVPEPSSVLLYGMAMAALCVNRRRRTRGAHQ